MFFKIFSPAKLNLYLNVIGKYPDSYHKIESVFCRIDFSDTIYIKEIKKGLKVKTLNYRISQKNNLVFKICKALKERFKIKKGLEIVIDKKIPLKSGLGGAASDAASVLLFLNKFWRLNLKIQELVDFSKKFGKDIPFFLYEKSYALVEGKGEKVTPLEINKKYKFLLALSKKGLSTQKVFSQCENLWLTKDLPDINIFIYLLKEGIINLLKDYYFNSLERIAQTLKPDILKMKDYFLKKGFEFVGMSGSGPSLFCIINSTKQKHFCFKSFKDWFFVEAQVF